METLPKQELKAKYIEREHNLPTGSIYHVIHVINSPADENAVPRKDLPTPSWAKKLPWLMSSPEQLYLYIAPDDDVNEKADYFKSLNMKVSVEKKIVQPDTREPEEKYFFDFGKVSTEMLTQVIMKEKAVSMPLTLVFPEKVKFLYLRRSGDALYNFKNVKSLVWEDITLDPKIFTQDSPFYNILSVMQTFKAILEDPSEPVEFSSTTYNIDDIASLQGKVFGDISYNDGFLAYHTRKGTFPESIAQNSVVSF